MWLVNISTLSLESFVEGSVPEYVALSHRWTAEELTFKEVIKNRVDRSKKGWRKLEGACLVARTYGVRYIWIDTCCIDKKSSAELSEAINSMFRWYREAKACVAYLEDVHVGPTCDGTFKNSVWFTRAWTLQELLAPQEVYFYDHGWACIGNRTEHAKLIEEVTGIQYSVLTKDRPLEEISVGRKMSWAAKRVATREEDVAYSLFGMFDINLPPLYGEGSKAFTRLQEEILRHSADTSIFFWGLDKNTRTLLASSPADFRYPPCEAVKGRSYTATKMRVLNLGIEFEDVDAFRWGLTVYGIEIGQLDSRPCALLVIKRPPSNAWYRVGIRPTPINKFVMNRKFTVIWGGRNQLDEADWNYIPPSYGFALEPEASLSVNLGSVTYTDPFPPPKEIAWTAAEHVGRQVIQLERPCIQSSYSFTYDSGGALRLYFNVAFDFDSRPCVLVSRRQIEIAAWKASEQCVGHDPIPISQDRQVKMYSVTGKSIDQGPLYMFRNYYTCCAPIPIIDASEGDPVWLTLHCPRTPLNHSNYCKLAISETKPQISYFAAQSGSQHGL